MGESAREQEEKKGGMREGKYNTNPRVELDILSSDNLYPVILDSYPSTKDV